MPHRLQTKTLSLATSEARILPPARQQASVLPAESVRALLSKMKSTTELEPGQQDRFDRMQEKQTPSLMQQARRIEGQARWA